MQGTEKYDKIKDLKNLRKFFYTCLMGVMYRKNINRIISIKKSFSSFILFFEYKLMKTTFSQFKNNKIKLILSTCEFNSTLDTFIICKTL